MLKTRMMTALVLLSVTGLCLFSLPPLAWIAFCTVLLIGATFEWTRFARYDKVGQNIYIVSTLFISYLLLLYSNSHTILWLYYAGAIFWLVVVPLWLKNKWLLAKHSFIAALCGWVILLPAFDVLYQARISLVWTYKLMGIIAIVWIADSAAYFVGRAVGKHKLAPSISPGKSWEGVIGAMVIVGIYALLMAYKVFLLTQPFVIFLLIFLAWLLTAISVMGDLLESLFKRQLGVKDSGNLLPGHGGVLDRLDSLLALLPFAGILILWTI